MSSMLKVIWLDRFGIVLNLDEKIFLKCVSPYHPACLFIDGQDGTASVSSGTEHCEPGTEHREPRDRTTLANKALSS